MKRLILMRHAKSDWSGGPSSDHNRPLNRRGRRAAAALGQWLVEHGLLPDEVLSSSSMRTRETCARLNLPEDTPTRFLRELYLADPEVILSTLKEAQGSCVLMIGHNPGIGMMAEMVLDRVPEHPQFMRYPTGATLVADVEVAAWTDMRWGLGTLRHFIVPRELE